MRKTVFPFIPNSVPEIKARMMEEIGINDVEEIYAEIPEKLRFKGSLDIPGPFLSEYEMRRHVEGILSKNKNCAENLSFLGGGCWQHYVPSVCKTIAGRDEFLTAYVGDTFADHGKFQALFEYASLMGELIDMDLVSCPTYDWSSAAGSAIRMAARITNRSEVVLPRTLSRDRLLNIQNLCRPVTPKIHFVEFDPQTGQMDLADLRSKVSENTAAVYFENPSYLGFIETQGSQISAIAHEFGAKSIAGVDPISLGVLTPPGQYGADMVVGDLQPLGIPMYWGGGQAGFLGATARPEYVYESPFLFIGMIPTSTEGEYSFGQIYYERTSYIQRDLGKDFSGTTTNLYGIIAGTYLALMGPQGMREIGETILSLNRYAAARLAELPGVKLPFECAPHFKEMLVSFADTGKSVKEINQGLLQAGIFGGKDLSEEIPELGSSALFAFTEIHTQADIDRLVAALASILAG